MLSPNEPVVALEFVLAPLRSTDVLTDGVLSVVDWLWAAQGFNIEGCTCEAATVGRSTSFVVVPCCARLAPFVFNAALDVVGDTG